MIDKNTRLEDLAFIVSTKLKEAGVESVLVGGAVVSIYTLNEYESGDLDFISSAESKKIDEAMKCMGFEKSGKSYKSKKTDFFVEFPSGPVSVGDEVLTDFSEIKRKDLSLKLFTPTQSIMDRLAAFYFWNDIQSLDQAVLIACKQSFSLQKIKQWSLKEGEEKKFLVFKQRLRNTKS